LCRHLLGSSQEGTDAGRNQHIEVDHAPAGRLRLLAARAMSFPRFIGQTQRVLAGIAQSRRSKSCPAPRHVAELEYAAIMAAGQAGAWSYRSLANLWGWTSMRQVKAVIELVEAYQEEPEHHSERLRSTDSKESRQDAAQSGAEAERNGADPERPTRAVPSSEDRGGKKGMSIPALWEGLVAVNGRHLKLDAARRAKLKARLKDYTGEQVLLAFQWMKEAPDAGYLREGPNRHDKVDTLLQASKMSKYVEAAEVWREGSGPSPVDIESKPWLEPCSDQPWEFTSTSTPAVWLMLHRDQVAAMSLAIKAQGGGWAEMQAWLAGRLREPGLVLDLLKRQRQQGAAK